MDSAELRFLLWERESVRYTKRYGDEKVEKEIPLNGGRPNRLLTRHRRIANRRETTDPDFGRWEQKRLEARGQ